MANPPLKLTNKQEAFAVKYVECGNATEAYRFAYNAENMTGDVIHVKAYEALNNGKVSVRVAELKEKAQKAADKKFEWTMEQKREMLRNIAYNTVEEKPDVVIRAIDQDNKMTGGHAPQKIEGSMSHNVSFDLTPEQMEVAAKEYLMTLGYEFD